MSWQAINAVLRHSQTKGAARLLLLAIAHHAGPEGKGARPGAALLEAETKIDRREIKRLTRKIQLLEELKVKTGGGFKANEYTLLLPMDTIGELTTGGTGTTGAATTSGGAAVPPQQTVVVSDVGFNKSNNNIGRAQLLDDLEREGVKSAVAVDLVTRFAARVIEQLAYLDDRSPKDRAATLVSSIKGNWAPPAAYLKRVEAERSQEAQREANARQIAAQAEKKASPEVTEAEQIREGARLDATFEALGEAEKAAIAAQVEKRIALLPAPMRTDFGRQMMRREILKGENNG